MKINIILTWIGATILGALVPVPILAAFFHVMTARAVSVSAFIREFLPYLGAMFPITLGFAVVLGLPVALFCRRKRWTHWSVAVVVGVLIGLIGALMIIWLLQSALLTSRELALIAAVGGASGVLGALAFWATLKLFGELEPRRRGDAGQAPV
ncbi:MAG: hypothetical protein AB1586_12900 [Pseudomonadota bacterium]